MASTTARTRSASSTGAPPIFSWNTVDPRRPGTGGELGHLLGLTERDGDVEREALLAQPAEQDVAGDVDDLSEQVPARHVEHALGVAVASQSQFHGLGDTGQAGHVDAEHAPARAPRGRR